MPNPPRRVPVPAPNPHQYYPVSQQGPSSPPRSRSSYATTSNDPRYTSRTQSAYTNTQSQAAAPVRPYMHRDVTRGIATGIIGNGYGPYSYEPMGAGEYAAYHQSTNQYPTSVAEPPRPPPPRRQPSLAPQTVINTSTVPAFMWDTKDPDLDDPLHNPDPIRDAKLDHAWTIWSSRGWANAIMLAVILLGLIVLFAGYPIIHYVEQKAVQNRGGYGIGGINATGQIPALAGMPTLVDPATPEVFKTRTGTDGKKYLLVFSDEFEKDDRTFYPGDDPFWEAADMHYWPTGDIEWYDPSAITTKGGKMVITMSMKRNHDMNFMSGMITSWNKLCFTTGYVEMSVSMPGSPNAPGLWPAGWTMGNLGRAGYGATTEGLWPYTYDSCDTGTFPYQMDANGYPEVAKTSGNGGSQLSGLPGQRLSACTCPGSDHPGPRTNKGRGAPEIDIFETQIDVGLWRGQASQSAQIAPFNPHYELTNNATPATTVYDSTRTKLNTYKGGPYQQAGSALTLLDNQNYNDTGYGTHGFEWWSNPSKRQDGYITWFSEGHKTWTMTSDSVGPNADAKVGQRLISEEPHYIIMNLGMSPDFQAQDFTHMQFPAKMFIDYVRVYQREDVNDQALTCNPRDHPTAKYIDKHITAYTNANLTTWKQANQTFPRNSLYNGCF